MRPCVHAWRRSKSGSTCSVRVRVRVRVGIRVRVRVRVSAQRADHAHVGRREAAEHAHRLVDPRPAELRVVVDTVHVVRAVLRGSGSGLA